MITEIVYAGYGNTVDLLLTADGTAQDLSGVTRMVLTVTRGGSTITVDSATTPSAFDWVSSGVTGKVILSLGGVSGIISGRARLILYDATYTDGLVWGEFNLSVQ